MCVLIRRQGRMRRVKAAALEFLERPRTAGSFGVGTLTRLPVPLQGPFAGIPYAIGEGDQPLADSFEFPISACLL